MAFQRILIFLTRLNFIYPNFLGLSYLKRKRWYRRNYLQYDNEKPLLDALNHYISEIPFYQNLNINKLKSIQEFEEQVPLISKNEIMANWKYFVIPSYNERKVVEGTTGGTSGKPLRMIIPKNRHVVELNTMFAMWKNVGWNGQLRAIIRNAKLKQGEQFKVNPLKKEVIFDGFNTDTSYYEFIYSTIKKYNIKYIHAYPSSAFQFSLFLKNTKKDVSFIRAFLCGSEGVQPFQKSLIQDDLGIDIYNWYGHSEKLILGGPCSGNSDIHIEPTYGYFELIDEDDKPVKKIGQFGELVGTALHNPYMGFVRYRTGDYAEYAGDYCPHCKRHLTLLSNIRGRWDKNRIYTKDNSYVTITALNLHSEIYTKIDGLQYIQSEKGNLEILIIKGRHYDNKTDEKLREHYTNAIGDKCSFSIRFVDALIKEKNGKFLPLKQKLTE